MDQQLISIISKKLKISEDTFKKAYNDGFKEYLDMLQAPEECPSRKNYCCHNFVTGENSGKICGLLPKNLGVEASHELDGKHYCKAHLTSMLKKKQRGQTLRLNGLHKPVIIEDKLETEQLGDFEVLKDTMLIIDRSKNCCSGKLVEGHPTNVINSREEEFLKSKNVDHYRCQVESADKDIISTPVEKIDLESLLE